MVKYLDRGPNKFSNGFANLFNGVKTHVFRYSNKGGVVQNRDSLLHSYRSTGNGTEIAFETLSDVFVQSCYDRLLEVMSEATLLVEPASDSDEDKEAARFIEKTYTDKFREIAIETLALAKITGCAAHENNYGLDSNNKVIVKSITPIDSDRLIYIAKQDSNDFDLRIETLKNPTEGEAPPKEKIVDFTFWSVYINNASYGLGIGSQLVSFVQTKEELLNLWIRIAERYSTPIKIGSIPDIAEAEEIDEFFLHFQEMSENATFLLPPGFDMRVEDISATGSEALLQSLINYCDERIATLILGENLTGREITNGAQARDAIASRITERKALSLLNQIGKRLEETTVSWLTAMNFAGAKPPTLKFEFESAPLSLMDRLTMAKQLQIPLDEDRVAELLDVPITKEPTKGLGDRVNKDFSLPQDI